MLQVKNKNFTLSDLWIDYAKEFLQETNYLPNNKVCVNYNLWVSDVNYRREVANRLNLDFTDAGFDEVRRYGEEVLLMDRISMAKHQLWMLITDGATSQKTLSIMSF